MGCCYCRQFDDVFQYPASREDQCLRGVAACGFTEEPCKTDDCAITASLANYISNEYGQDDIVIFAVRPMFDVLYDLRDELLLNTGVGRELMRLYEEHRSRALEVLQGHPELLHEALRLLAYGAALGSYVLGVHRGRKEPRIAGMLFDQESHESATAFLRHLREIAHDREFEDAFQFVENLLSQCAGRSTAEIHQLLRLTAIS